MNPRIGAISALHKKSYLKKKWEMATIMLIAVKTIETLWVSGMDCKIRRTGGQKSDKDYVVQELLYSGRRKSGLTT